MDFLSLLPSLFQGGAGLAQLFGGLFGQPKRPTYTIPTAATDALNVAKRTASQTKLPGQDVMETQLGENTANMTKNLERMGAGGAGLGALSNIYAQESNARRNLGVDAARYYQGNQGMLQNALGRYAGYQDKAWDKNVGEKYQQQSAASSALIQSGMSNTFAGLNNVAGANSYANLFDNKTTPTTDNGVLGQDISPEIAAYLKSLGMGGNTNPYYQNTMKF